MISADNDKVFSNVWPLKLFNNGPRYIDLFRKVHVHATPEEKVRIRAAFFLRDILGVPVEMIHNECHLSHYIINENLRADIVVCPPLTRPLAVVECKSNLIGVTD